MKQSVSVLFILIFSMLLLSCSKQPSDGTQSIEIVQTNESNIEELSLFISDLMAKGDFKTIEKYLSENLSSQGFDGKKLGDAYQKVLSTMGDYLDKRTAFSVKKNERAIDVLQEFSLSNLRISLVFNNQNKLEGIWLAPEPIKSPLVKNDIFEEIEVKVGVEKPLDGKLTLPLGVEKPPIIILIHGSGPNDMDETIGKSKNKVFRDLAHGLAKKGIASLRYNKRTMQYPGETPEDVTIDYETCNDVKEAIQLLSKDDRINQDKIFILGHSLGGMVGPKIAFEENTLRGFISLAGSPRKLEDIIFDQNKFVLNQLKHLSNTNKNKALAQVEEMVKQVKQITPNSNLTPFNIPSSYWISLNELIPMYYAYKLEIPCLILQGDADFQVTVESDFSEWKKGLSTRENVSFKVYPGLNHLFMKTSGIKNISDYDIPNNVSEEVINDIAKWVFQIK